MWWGRSAVCVTLMSSKMENWKPRLNFLKCCWWGQLIMDIMGLFFYFPSCLEYHICHWHSAPVWPVRGLCHLWLPALSVNMFFLFFSCFTSYIGFNLFTNAHAPLSKMTNKVRRTKYIYVAELYLRQGIPHYCVMLPVTGLCDIMLCMRTRPSATLARLAWHHPAFLQKVSSFELF